MLKRESRGPRYIYIYTHTRNGVVAGMHPGSSGTLEPLHVKETVPHEASEASDPVHVQRLRVG
jgi:hypothetical protein